jgi:serine protease AprX
MILRRFIKTVGLMALSLGVGTGAVHAQSSAQKADAFLQPLLTAKSVRASGWTSVIVRIDGPLTAEREGLLTQKGAFVYRRLPIVGSVAVRVPRRDLSRVAALPWVQRLSADVAVQKSDAFIVEHSLASVARRDYGLTGKGIVVAVLDSGIDDHPDFAPPGGSGSRVVRSVSFVPESGDDRCGHGTHVAGIIAGNGAASTGPAFFQTFTGIAPQSNLVSVKVLDKNGAGSVSATIAGIQWILSNRAQYKVRILNVSLGHPVGESYLTDPLCQAVEQAWKSGIFVVCAAGNRGRLLQNINVGFLGNEGWGTAYGSIEAPGNDPYVLTVGATKDRTGVRLEDRVTTYSSRGPSRLDLVLKPDLLAPGNLVISTLAEDSKIKQLYGSTNQILESSYKAVNGNKRSKDYFVLSGTSMAVPVVAGSAALLLEQDPTLTPDTLKVRLMASADKVGSDICTYGAGILNVSAALNSRLTPMDSVLSPKVYRDVFGNVYIGVGGLLGLNGGLWGILGGSELGGTKAIWGTDAFLPGSSDALSSSKAIWGTSVWSDKAIWGTSFNQVDLSSTVVNGESK